MEAKALKVAKSVLYGSATSAYSEHFEEFAEHGIFHGIANYMKNKSLKIKAKNILFTIEWE